MCFDLDAIRCEAELFSIFEAFRERVARRKRCGKCKSEKTLWSFHNDSKRPDGRYPNCKECHYAYMRNRYRTSPNEKPLRIARYERLKNDPDFIAKAKRRSAKHYGSVEGRARSLMSNARKSPDGCALTLDHIKQGIARGRCVVTGIAFDMTIDQLATVGRHTNPFAPSLDRKDPRQGYTNENTRVVIWQYNLMKGEITDEEVLAIAQTLVARNAS